MSEDSNEQWAMYTREDIYEQRNICVLEHPVCLLWSFKIVLHVEKIHTEKRRQPPGYLLDRNIERQNIEGRYRMNSQCDNQTFQKKLPYWIRKHRQSQTITEHSWNIQLKQFWLKSNIFQEVAPPYETLIWLTYLNCKYCKYGLNGFIRLIYS